MDLLRLKVLRMLLLALAQKSRSEMRYQFEGKRIRVRAITREYRYNAFSLHEACTSRVG